MSKFINTILLVFSLICTAFAADAKPYEIAESEGVRIHQYASQVLKIAYERANLPLNIRVMPGQRALKLVSSGNLDGDVARIKAITNAYPNLILVPTPVAHFTAYAYGINPNIKVDNWQDLQGYRIATMRGVQYAKTGTEGMMREFYDSYETMLNMLVLGRIDVIITSEFEINSNLVLPYKKYNIQRLGKPLFESPLYHVLHRSHADIIDDINQELIKMTQDKEMEQLTKEFLNQ